MILYSLVICTTATLSVPEWTPLDSGTNTSIRGISAVDEAVCWIGTKSGVARTVDGGKTWKFANIGAPDAKLDFRDLHAFDARRCVAMSAGVGTSSRIYRTEDGGKTWRMAHQNTEPKGFFNGIAFKDAKHGILAGDPIGGRLFLLATDDGGATWNRIAKDSAPPMQSGEHAFAASGTHLTVSAEGNVWVSSGGATARVFGSQNWGKTWETIDTPMISGRPSTGIFSIAMHGRDGIAVGGDYEKETDGKQNAMRTRDAGKTWQLITTTQKGAPFTFRSCVGYVDEQTLVAVGPAGTDISRDGGATWKALPGKTGFHTLSIAGRIIWAAGADGRMGRLALPEARPRSKDR